MSFDEQEPQHRGRLTYIFLFIGTASLLAPLIIILSGGLWKFILPVAILMLLLVAIRINRSSSKNIDN